MTTQEHENLLNKYARQIVDDMSINELRAVAFKSTKEDWQDYTYEDLVEDVKEFYPNLLT